jgi:hypothetical protein
MDSIQIATTEFLNKQIAALQEAIEKKDAMIISLQDRSSEHSQNLYRSHEKYDKLVREVAQWTREKLSNEDISSAVASELATLVDFTLSQNYDVTMTVEHTFTVSVEAGEDIDDILNTIDFNVESYHVDLINEDSNVVDTNYDPVEY